MNMLKNLVGGKKDAKIASQKPPPSKKDQKTVVKKKEGNIKSKS